MSTTNDDSALLPRIERERLLSGAVLLSAVVHAGLLATIMVFAPDAVPSRAVTVEHVVYTPPATIEWQKITPIVEIVVPPHPEAPAVEVVTAPGSETVAAADPTPEPEPDAAAPEPQPEPPRERTQRREARRERREREQAPEAQQASASPAETEPPPPPTVAPATIPIDDPGASPEESYARDGAPHAGVGNPTLAAADTDAAATRAGSGAHDRAGETAAPDGGDDGEVLLRSYRRTLQSALRSQVQYPDRAQRRGIEGTVVVEVRVDRAGRILEARVYRSSGHEILDNAVIDAMLARGTLPAPPDGVDWNGRPIRIPFPFRIT
jgi:protein TonB